MFSLVIKNAKIIDGLGNPWRRADLGVQGDRIAFIGRIERPEAERIIDGQDRAVCPGFIDLHSHGEMILLSKRQMELMAGRIRQGITTEIIGNCGIGAAPVTEEMKPALAASLGFLSPEPRPWTWNSLGEFLDELEKTGLPINVGTLSAHGPIRTAVKGFAAGQSNPLEVKKEQDLLRATLEEGSFGFSCGLIYAPGMFSDTNELIELGKVVAEYDGLFTSHVRGSSETAIEAEEELISIGQHSGCRVHHSHYEAFGQAHWPKIETILGLDEAARRRGVDIALDMFPYTAANTMMIAIYPPWSLEGGWAEFLKRVKDPQTRQKIAADIESLVPIWPTWLPGRWPHNLVKATGWENILIGYVPSQKNKKYQGLSLAELGKARGQSPFEAITDLMIEEDGHISQLIFGVSGDRATEEPMLAILTHPLAGYATDSWDLGTGQPHPADYGTFPRILGRYVREQKRLTLEDAIRRMTSFPASRLGLKDRGIIAKGYFADLVVFDPETIADRATYEAPRQFPTGLDYVIVNGQVLVEGDEIKPIKPGRVLRKA